MPLTTVVGSSGSGKTTFLNDVHKSHKCTYIRQYHNVRPYITVRRIPNFDPTHLPYWDIYTREGRDHSIRVGGTMAGKFTAGLSGGQRKLLLFELIYQRIMKQSQLLIVLDEPFAGVTDDFVPFIVQRLNEMRRRHNILLVTNDHVDTLTEMADNTITVSAIDRTTVKINAREKVDREKAILALSVGHEYVFTATNDDLLFFWDVEIRMNTGLIMTAGFTIFAFSMFVPTYWDSSVISAPLLIVAGGIIAFFALNPYLLSLVDWRNYMTEEAEALLHASKSMNKLLMTILVMVLLVIISAIEYAMIQVVMDDLTSIDYWVAILFDSISMTSSFVCLALYTNIPHQTVEVVGSLPTLFTIFFSTTFSPGAGVDGLKSLRFFFSRFYFWCMLPYVQDQMEGCPEDPDKNLLYLCLSACLTITIFVTVLGAMKLWRVAKKKKAQHKKKSMQEDQEYRELQLEMYGEKTLRKLRHADSGVSSLTDGHLSDGNSSTKSGNSLDNYSTKQVLSLVEEAPTEKTLNSSTPAISSKRWRRKGVMKVGGDADEDDTIEESTSSEYIEVVHFNMEACDSSIESSLHSHHDEEENRKRIFR